MVPVLVLWHVPQLLGWTMLFMFITVKLRLSPLWTVVSSLITLRLVLWTVPLYMLEWLCLVFGSVRPLPVLIRCVETAPTAEKFRMALRLMALSITALRLALPGTQVSPMTSG